MIPLCEFCGDDDEWCDACCTPRTEDIDPEPEVERRTGTVDGYKWEVSRERALGGWVSTYYSVYTNCGLEICCDFTSGPIEDGVEACLAAIEDHQEEGFEVDLING